MLLDGGLRINANTDAYGNSNYLHYADNHSNTQLYADHYAYLHSKSHAKHDCHPNLYTIANPNLHSNLHGDAESYSDVNTHSHAHNNTYSNSHSYSNSGSRRC